MTTNKMLNENGFLYQREKTRMNDLSKLTEDELQALLRLSYEKQRQDQQKKR